MHVLTELTDLQVLVELAQERDEDIPALVYEARSTGQPRRPPHRQQAQARQRHAAPITQLPGSASAALQQVTIGDDGNMPPGGQSVQPGRCSDAQQIQRGVYL